MRIPVMKHQFVLIIILILSLAYISTAQQLATGNEELTSDNFDSHDYDYYADLLNTSGMKLDQSLDASSPHDILKQENLNPIIDYNTTLYRHNVNIVALAVSMDENYITSVDTGGEIRIWDVDNKDFSLIFDSQVTVSDLIWSADYLIGAASNEIKVWNTDGSLKWTLTGHTDTVNALAINPAGTLLASASEDTNIKIWDLGDGSLTTTITGHSNHVNDIV